MIAAAILRVFGVAIALIASFAVLLIKYPGR